MKLKRDDPEQAYEEAKEAAASADAEWRELRERRQQREERLEDLRGQLQEAERQREATALVPGSGSGGTATLRRTGQLEAEIAELEEEEEQAKERWEAAQKAQADAARALARHRAEDAREARKELVEALEDLGREAVRAYEDVVQAEQQVQASTSGLRELFAAASSTRRQERELEQYLDEPATGVSDDVKVGYLVARLFRWSRHGNSTLEGLWQDRAISLLRGSVRHAGILGPLEPLLADFENDQIPL